MLGKLGPSSAHERRGCPAYRPQRNCGPPLTVERLHTGVRSATNGDGSGEISGEIELEAGHLAPARQFCNQPARPGLELRLWYCVETPSRTPVMCPIVHVCGPRELPSPPSFLVHKGRPEPKDSNDEMHQALALGASSSGSKGSEGKATITLAHGRGDLVGHWTSWGSTPFGPSPSTRVCPNGVP
jgi:hypothetical protein